MEFYAPWCGHCKNLAPELAKVGAAVEKTKPQHVVVGKVNCDAHSAVCQKYGVRGYPTLKFFPKGKTEPEEYDRGRTADDLVGFLNDRAGAYLKLDKPLSFVTALTPQTFDDIVMDSSKHVLVEFYAPWCGHCKKLEPDYEKVAKAFRLQKNVVVAKVDADKHRDLSQKYGVQGFPTIKYFAAGSSDKKAEDYNLGRTPEDFLKFLNDKADGHRTLEGILDDGAGKILTLDNLVADFKKASGDAKKEIIGKVEKVVAEQSGDKKTDAEYYLRALRKMLDSEDYASKELARLKRIMSDVSQVSEDRLDNMKTRINILSSFQ